jgi:2-oxoisovalerate dehydrogenase E1 component
MASPLLDFMALNCPSLIETARRIESQGLDQGQTRRALAEAIKQGSVAGFEGADLLGTGRSLAWTREMLLETVEGCFRIAEICGSLTAAERLEMYRVMLLSRALDELLKRLFSEKKIAWEGHPSPQKGFRAFGQEAAVGLVLRLRRGSEEGDIVGLLTRGLPLLLMCLDDPARVVLAQCGKKGTLFDGRDLHVGDLSRGVLPPTAPLAISTQTLVGMAYAAKLRRQDRVFLSVMGEGGTSLGEWHEAVNFAAVQRLNVIFVVENNHWALGTHWSEQTAAPRFALRAAGYGIPGVTVFGNDPDTVAATSAWAAERARAGKGPTLVELVTYRRAGHAHHDDDRYHGAGGVKGYEFEEERKAWEGVDPLALYEVKLRVMKLIDNTGVAALREETARRVTEAERAAEAAPWPGKEDIQGRLFAPRLEPVPATPSATKPMTYDEAVHEALAEAMERDPRVFIVGEDVGGRYGGAFGVTRGLARRFGPGRCLNAPIAESAIIGCGVGAALAGMRPVVEMQFADFLACGFNALVNNAAKVHWRWGRAVPMVVRLPYGGATGTGEKLLGGGPYHSQCPEAWLLRTPGLKVVAPATPLDAKGLLTAALRDNNPVVFLEAKGLYGFFRPDLREEVPVGDFEVPIGRAVVRREGRDVSVLAYGAMVGTALASACALAKEGIEAEVVDLRTLAPLDEAAVLASVSKTHRAVVVHEDTRTGGFGAELVALLVEKAFWELEAPVARVTAPDTPVPYSPPLEHAFLPKAGDVAAAVRAVMNESS